MLNFSVGPVQMSENVRNIGAEQVPYFRTTEFSEVMFENERLIKKFVYAPVKSRVVFMTGSGTASMEATIMNTLSTEDKVLVVNGGSFGARFVELCKIHDVAYSEIKLNTGEKLKYSHLEPFENKGYTGFIVNVHETSTGVLYDMDLISDFCKRNHLFLVVDAISSFMADTLDMTKSGIDVVIIGSQKALACPPGVSIMVLSDNAIKRIENKQVKSMYFDLKSALKNGERGQTPFTPAVGILRQIHARLCEVEKNGGVENEILRVSEIADDFRNQIQELPLQIVSESLSNAVTPLHPINGSAYDIFTILKDEYNIWICPNGGAMAEKIFRVGHIGMLTAEDNKILVDALKDLQRRGIL